LNVAIVGDILHSRVARSNIHLLTKLGATVRVAGPGTLVPNEFQFLIDNDAAADNPKSKIQNPKLEVVPRIEDAIEGADVVMILRIQRERQDSAYFPTLREYSIHYGLTNDRLNLAKKDAIVLHPGPMNRGIEISSDVADSSRSLILDQVKYGVAVRMAVLYLATGGSMTSS
jgi:aspartate carbamoyltransferase catalytic subunit